MTERESHTFLFADLAGFTALTEAHGDAEATEIAERFAADVRALLPQYRAVEVKTIGDEVMVRVDDPLEAVRLGLRIVDELATPGAPPVRVGMHSGPALERSGDWFGATVNLASRVSGAARPGEVLVTADTRGECGEQDGIEFQARGGRHFKHIPDPVPVYLAADMASSSKELEIDPVCPWPSIPMLRKARSTGVVPPITSALSPASKPSRRIRAATWPTAQPPEPRGPDS